MKFSKIHFTAAGCSMMVFLSSCKISTQVATGNSMDPAFESVLAAISGTFEDFEFNSNYRTDSSGRCTRSVSCGVSSPTVNNIFNSCAAVPGTTALVGSTHVSLTTSACSGFITGSAPTVSLSSQKTFSAFIREDSLGSTAVNVPSGITGLYSPTNDQWQVLIPSMTRVTTSGSSIVSSYTLESSSVLTTTGRRSAKNRVLLSEGLTVTDVVKGVVYSISPQTLQWGSSTCCYPTYGKLTASVSGTTANPTYVAHTETLEFSSTLACGEATYTGSTGVATSVELTHGCE